MALLARIYLQPLPSGVFCSIRPVVFGPCRQQGLVISCGRCTCMYGIHTRKYILGGIYAAYSWGHVVPSKALCSMPSAELVSCLHSAMPPDSAALPMPTVLPSSLRGRATREIQRDQEGKQHHDQSDELAHHNTKHPLYRYLVYSFTPPVVLSHQDKKTPSAKAFFILISLCFFRCSGKRSGRTRGEGSGTSPRCPASAREPRSRCWRSESSVESWPTWDENIKSNHAELCT